MDEYSTDAVMLIGEGKDPTTAIQRPEGLIISPMEIIVRATQEDGLLEILAPLSTIMVKRGFKWIEINDEGDVTFFSKPTD